MRLTGKGIWRLLYSAHSTTTKTVGRYREVGEERGSVAIPIRVPHSAWKYRRQVRWKHGNSVSLPSDPARSPEFRIDQAGSDRKLRLNGKFLHFPPERMTPKPLKGKGEGGKKTALLAVAHELPIRYALVTFCHVCEVRAFLPPNYR